MNRGAAPNPLNQYKKAFLKLLKLPTRITSIIDHHTAKLSIYIPWHSSNLIA